MLVILEIAIGIVFVYLLLSVVASALTEWVAGIFKLRSKTLETGIRELLNDPQGRGLANAVYEHPLIKGLSRDGSKPSYIPSGTFALALLDVIAPVATGPAPAALDQLREAIGTLQDSSLKTAVLALAMALTSAPPTEVAAGAEPVRSWVERIDNPDVRRAVLALMDQPGAGAANLLPRLEQWFNDAMARVSGWYKRQAQLVTIGAAVAIGLLLNADTLMIADGLARDPAVRAAVVAAAQQEAVHPPPSQPTLDIAAFQKQANQLQLPIGWSTQTGDARGLPSDAAGWLRKVLGLLLTIVAISLGAPFWFELLNKLLNLRLTGKPQ